MVTIGELRELEGREVSLALADGSHLDSVTLVSAGRHRVPTLWVYAAGADVFVPRSDVVAAGEAPVDHVRPSSARR